MDLSRVQKPALIAFILLTSIHCAYGWGALGHQIVCTIAQSMFSANTATAVSNLLPYHPFTSECSWADDVRSIYTWSPPLHFVDSADVCNYNYLRDCHDSNGVLGNCVVGAINNYTNQLLGYGSPRYNLTQALLFLSHFMGDVHQPLHCGFASDEGGNLIPVKWYTKSTNLHSVWDTSIIQSEMLDFYGNSLDALIAALQTNISSVWSDQVATWESCSSAACPDTYAEESIEAACAYSYNGVQDNSVLADPYFYKVYPEVNLRLAEAGVRLATTLNKIFG